jgi:glycosyltransferase involved in cell wall biosynthesis
MQVFIDALSAREGGGITYVRSLLPMLAQVDENNECAVLLSNQYQTQLLKELPAPLHVIPFSLSSTSLLRRWLFQQVTLPRLIQERGVDLLFSVSEVSPVPHVVTAQNLKIFTPPWRANESRATVNTWKTWFLREGLARLSLRYATRIIFVSDLLRQKVVQRLHLDPTKTRVVHHGVDEIFRKAPVDVHALSPPWSSLLEQHPFILAVSTLASHKNYETLIRGFGLFVKEKETADATLVIAGDTSDQVLYASLKQRVEELAIADRVFFLGKIPHEHLPLLYQRARMFVFPSRLESFGLPLVEAMASGTPILASDIPVCREVCQTAALFFDVTDAPMLARQMKALWDNDNLRADLKERGHQRALDFSWTKAAIQMTQIFREAVGRD